MSKVTLMTAYLQELQKIAADTEPMVPKDMKERLLGGALYGVGHAGSKALTGYQKATKKRWWRGGKSKEAPADSLKSLGKQVGGRFLHQLMMEKTHNAAKEGYQHTGQLQAIRNGYSDRS